MWLPSTYETCRKGWESLWEPNGNMKNDDVRSKPEVAPRLRHQKLRLLVCSDLLYLN